MRWLSALDEARLRIELAYACEATAKAPNQAPWSYIEGLMRGRSYDKFPEVLAHIENFSLQHQLGRIVVLLCWHVWWVFWRIKQRA